MKLKIPALLLTALVASLTASPAATPVNLSVAVDQPGHPISPTLWGIFYEDINLSTDGGLYAELVRNRNFEDAAQPDHWSAVAGDPNQINFAIDTTNPVSPKNPRCLKIVASPANGTNVGVANGGFYGMGIHQGATYQLSLLARGGDGFSGPLSVSLTSAGQPATTYATASLPALTGEWQKLTVKLKATASDPKARLVISTNRPGTFWLDMVSLFPQSTWRNRGLRPDLAEMLVALKPAFLRFPGGCWVEGDTMKESYRWKQTIGDPAERRTQANIWAYQATHGIGFHEYLQLCEDLGAAPLFCINAGMSHKENVPLEQMNEYVQDALDAIEYANGPVTSTWGALRAKAGHPAPFNLQYLEIGNENGGPAYNERYPLFVKAIRAKYPAIHLIANEWFGVPKDAPIEILDEHSYNTPDHFISQAGRYDSYARSGPKIFVGEYAVTQNAGLGNLRGAIGEAAFMTGLERNSDIVVMAAYAPLFCNANHKRWPINLINYDSTRCFGIPSYYVQKLFAENRGDIVLPVTSDEPLASGGVGVGTWQTQAEFKDMKVTSEGKPVFAADPARGTNGWRLHEGSWKIQDGALRQDSLQTNVRAMVGDASWKDYTYTLKARKLGGQEGFLIPFLVGDDQTKCWWNLGGWGNTRHGLEMPGVTAPPVDGKIETDRWYDIRIEVRGDTIRCSLDGRLIHEAKLTASASRKSLHVSAARDQAHGELILKVVNVASQPQPAHVKFTGARQITGPARALVLTSPLATDENTLDEPTKVAPVAQSLPVSATQLSHSFPANSLTVVRLKLN